MFGIFIWECNAIVPAMLYCFRESEDFELLFPNRLDDYLEGAKRLETLLSRQKDLLSHRLQGIGKTLQQE